MLNTQSIPTKSESISARNVVTGTIFALGLAAYVASLTALILELHGNLEGGALGTMAGGLLMGAMVRPLIMGKYDYDGVPAKEDHGLFGLGITGMAVGGLSFVMALSILDNSLDHSIISGIGTLAMITFVGYMEYRLHKSSTEKKLSI